MLSVRVDEELKERMRRLPGVNWSKFIRENVERRIREEEMRQAVQLRDAHIQGMIMLVAPDLLVYEVSNALRYTPALTAEDLKQVVAVI